MPDDVSDKAEWGEAVEALIRLTARGAAAGEDELKDKEMVLSELEMEAAATPVFIKKGDKTETDYDSKEPGTTPFKYRVLYVRFPKPTI